MTEFLNATRRILLTGEYIVVGNKRTFDSLNELVRHHTVHKIVATDDVALEVPCGQEGTNNESVTAMGL